MSNGLLDRAEQLPPLLQKAKPEPAAQALVRTGRTPRQYLGELMTAKHFADAVRVLAWALPRRDALWWACQCVRQVITGQDGPAEQAALQAAMRFTLTPSEEHRRAAETAAAAVEFATPAGCAALAAFWSEGSLAPPGAAPVPPPEHLTPTGVANAVVLATVHREPEKAEEKYRRFVALGLDVADGKDRPGAAPPSQPGPSPGRR
jgi:hypothetical protein